MSFLDNMGAAAVGPDANGADVVPDHTIVLIPMASADEARTLRALLNSANPRYIAQGYVPLHPSPHVMNYIPLPKFDAIKDLHGRLVGASCLVHDATESGDSEQVAAAKAGLERLTAEFWGLSKAELKDIQDSLEDLME